MFVVFSCNALPSFTKVLLDMLLESFPKRVTPTCSKHIGECGLPMEGWWLWTYLLLAKRREMREVAMALYTHALKPTMMGSSHPRSRLPHTPVQEMLYYDDDKRLKDMMQQATLAFHPHHSTLFYTRPRYSKVAKWTGPSPSPLWDRVL